MSLGPEDYAAVGARARCLVSPAEVEAALDHMAVEITARLAGLDPLVLCVMNGALVVSGHLLTRLDFQLRVDYIHATRYRGRTSGGEIAWVYRPSDAIRGQHLLVLDDILDEGVTLSQVIRACLDDGALSVCTAVLVEKRKPHACEADIVGLHLEDRYLIGCGLDYKGYFRNATGIYALADADL